MNTRFGWIRIAALAALVVSCTQSERDKEDPRCNVLPLNNRTLSPEEVQQQWRAEIQRSILVLSNETAHVQARIGQLMATIVSNKNCLSVETNEAERTRLRGILTTSEHHLNVKMWVNRKLQERLDECRAELGAQGANNAAQATSPAGAEHGR